MERFDFSLRSGEKPTDLGRNGKTSTNHRRHQITELRLGGKNLRGIISIYERQNNLFLAAVLVLHDSFLPITCVVCALSYSSRVSHRLVFIAGIEDFPLKQPSLGTREVKNILWHAIVTKMVADEYYFPTNLVMFLFKPDNTEFNHNMATVLRENTHFQL